MPEAKFKSFNGRMSVVKHLKVYRCTAFEHIPDTLRTKSQPKTKKLIFVGYATKEKAYRLWDPISDKVSISRDVVFNKEQMGIEQGDMPQSLLEEEPEYVVDEI